MKRYLWVMVVVLLFSGCSLFESDGGGESSGGGGENQTALAEEPAS